jgi:hypothetical protein
MQVSFVDVVINKRAILSPACAFTTHWQQHEHHLRFVHAKRLMSCVHSQPGSFFRTRYFAVGAQGDQRAGINAHPEREGHSICAGAVLSCRVACGVDWDVMLLAGYQRRAAPPLRAPRGNHP